MVRYFVFLVGLIVFACKPTSQTSTSQGGKYHEDLSAHRPTIEEPKKATEEPKEIETVKRDPKTYVEPQYTVNKQLNTVLDSINKINLTRRFIDGYTIQVYTGQKREDAMEAKKQLTTRLPEIESEVQYIQPNFKVKAGKYLNQLEAQKDITAIKKYFPTAIVVPDKIAIN